jgi:glycosyltransferase involved in cell wall biosynthesis
MKIVIATGIYPPEPGGPAYYAKHLADALRAKGHEVPVVTYGSLKRLPMGARHLAYWVRLLPHLWRADVVLALDTFSVALPVVLAAPLFRVPVVIRTGGDFLWEQYVERTGDMLPLPFFYERHQPFTRKERVIFALTRFVLARAILVFSTAFQRDIWIPAYGLQNVETHLIDNAVAGSFAPLSPERKDFLWYTRGIRFKNETVLREAFALAQKQVPDIVLETGMIPQRELIEKMRRCYAVILPSLAELSPNYILDALRCGKPFIQTMYSGFAEKYAAYGLTCDPLSAEDIAAKIVQLCDAGMYAELSHRIAVLPLTRTYTQVADDFLALFTSASYRV